MLRFTFLGHHGWVVSSERTRLLIAPLFLDRIGWTDEIELRVYPPKQVHLKAFPAIDAVMMSHEHEGHFDLPSLALLDRRIPVYLSHRSSVAMRAILAEMGFGVRLMKPGVPFQVGDLEVLPMTTDQLTHGVIEEWDTLTYVVKDREGHGNLFSDVDVRPTQEMWRTASQFVERPGLCTVANDATNLHFLASYLRPDTLNINRMTRNMLDDHAQLCQSWAVPEATLMIGGGFRFGGDRAWINQNAFLIDTYRHAEVLASLLADEKVIAPVPGQTLIMKKGALVDIEEKCGFLSLPPKSDWPSRAFTGGVDWIEGYEPACGQAELAPKALEELKIELSRFATFLYSSELFRRLYSLTEEDLEGRKPTFALMLLADREGRAYVFAYEPQSCSFVLVESEDPPSEFLAVYECWASDLLAYLRSELGTNTLTFGRHREWNANPQRFLFDLNRLLFVYNHPLRNPNGYLALYRKVLARQPEASLKIPFAQR